MILEAGMNADADVAVPLIHEAHEPFYRFCFEGRDMLINQFLSLAVRDRYAEVFIGRALVARMNGSPAGFAFLAKSDERQGFGRRNVFLLRQIMDEPSARHVFQRMRIASRAFCSSDTASLYVSRLAVIPASRRTGVGTYLIEGAAERARSSGLKGIELDVASDNAVALKFYLSRGFSAVAESSVSTETGSLAYRRLRRPVA